MNYSDKYSEKGDYPKIVALELVILPYFAG